MAQCTSPGCTREGTVESSVEAPFAMSASTSQTRRTELICTTCDEQNERMELLSK